MKTATFLYAIQAVYMERVQNPTIVAVTQATRDPHVVVLKLAHIPIHVILGRALEIKVVDVKVDLLELIACKCPAMHLFQLLTDVTRLLHTIV